MKTKLIKAYSTAWRWPQVYSESPSVVWASRSIAVVFPLIIVVLTFITGVSVLGTPLALLVAVFAGITLMVVTVRLFHTEYDEIEDYETRENRIKEYFHGFPAHTDIPLIEYETNEWIAYGHVDPKTFIEAIQTIILHVTDDQSLADQYAQLDTSVGHLYACFKDPREKHWHDGLNLCKPSERDSFPITRIEL
jgi:hypothetical protein